MFKCHFSLKVVNINLSYFFNTPRFSHAGVAERSKDLKVIEKKIVFLYLDNFELKRSLLCAFNVKCKISA